MEGEGVEGGGGGGSNYLLEIYASVVPEESKLSGGDVEERLWPAAVGASWMWGG